MAVSSVRVTEGSGPYLHTWQRSVSSVNREEQYVQFGESGIPTYIAMAYNISGATLDSHIVQLMAPSSSYVRIHRIFIEQAGNATSAGLMAMSLIRVSTAGTGGTSVTPAPFDTADTAGATAMTLPSSKGTESTVLFRVSLNARQTVAATGAQVDDSFLWETTPGRKPIIIPSGTSNGIVIKNGNAVAGSTWNVQIEFTETAWL